LTLSTVFYPIEVVRRYLPAFLVQIVSVNPLSLAAEAMRQYTFAGSPIDPWALIFLLLTSVPLAIVGALAYLKALRSIQVKGKL
jgi:ABC-type polysaccharide/polyol phosphate export permease